MIATKLPIEAVCVVAVHRDELGRPVPTISVSALPKACGEEMQVHLKAIAEVLERAYGARTKP